MPITSATWSPSVEACSFSRMLAVSMRTVAVRLVIGIEVRLTVFTCGNVAV